MIRFYRDIRQNQLAKGQLRNYIFYAIGEILLIVLGILIALAIDNWNQNRIIRHKEITYLQGLQKEFETNKIKLEELIQVNKKNYQGAIELIEIMDSHSTTIDEPTLSKLLFQTFAYDISFNANSSLLTEILNSGSLQFLTNDTLRKELTNWLSTLQDIVNQEYDLGQQREMVLAFFHQDDYSISTILNQTGIYNEVIGHSPTQKLSSNLNILSSKEFENYLLTFILTSKATEDAHYVPLLADVQRILHLINDDLNE